MARTCYVHELKFSFYGFSRSGIENSFSRAGSELYAFHSLDRWEFLSSSKVGNCFLKLGLDLANRFRSIY